MLAAVWMSAGEPFAAEPAEPKAPSRQAGAPADANGPRLELTITGPQKAAVGSQVTFELVVTNAGKSPAAKLLVIDDFEPGLAHEAASSPIEHDLKDLGAGESQRLGLTFRVTRPGKLAHRIEVTQQGKVLVAAKSSLTGVEPEPSPPAGKSPQPEVAEKQSGKETPKKAEQAKPARPAESDTDFPEITPRNEPPKEEKLPDLGPPLVEKPENLKRLNEKYPVWIDRQQRSVILVGTVCQRQVPLELFACLRGSKEHEAVLSIPTKAAFVHAALLAVGAEAGAPVQFRPKYVAASGSEIEIACVWKDEHGKRQTARAQDWVRNVKTGKAMELPWVFGGSRFLKNPVTGETYYQADADGDLICVSNFPGAMLDLPIASTSSDTELLFEGFADHIPPRGTPVTLILTPKPKKPAQAGAGTPSSGPASGKPAPPADESKKKTPATKPPKANGDK
jgi:uncharacterized repeat protein (TIGR01451 family)